MGQGGNINISDRQQELGGKGMHPATTSTWTQDNQSMMQSQHQDESQGYMSDPRRNVGSRQSAVQATEAYPSRMEVEGSYRDGYSYQQIGRDNAQEMYSMLNRETIEAKKLAEEERREKKWTVGE